MHFAGVLGAAPDPVVGLVAPADLLLRQRLQDDLDAFALLFARPSTDDVDRYVEGVSIGGSGDLLQRSQADLRVLVALNRRRQEGALELAALIEVQHRPRTPPAGQCHPRSGQRRPLHLLTPIEVLDGNAPELTLEDFDPPVGIGRHRQHAALDPQSPSAATPYGADHDRPAAVDLAVEQRVQRHDWIVVLGSGMDEVHDDARLLAGVASRHAAHTLLIDPLGRRRRQVQADGRARGVPTFGKQLGVDQHVDVTALISGEDLGELALGRLAGDGAGLEPEVLESLRDVVCVAHAGGVDDSRKPLEARLVQIRDREVERLLVKQLGQHLLVELHVDLATAQRDLGDRAHARTRWDSHAAQGGDDAAARRLSEVKARGLRGKEIRDVTGDQRARRSHADEDRLTPTADRR